MKTNHLTFTRILSLSALLFFFSCEQEEIKLNELNTVSSSHLTTTAAIGTLYECASPATTVASNTINLSGAIDCDYGTQWNSGSSAPAHYTITFASPRVFSGVFITAHAVPADVMPYTITAVRSNGYIVTVTENFTLANGIHFGNSTKEFDLGQGFVEYTSVRVDVGASSTTSWKAINEVELIVPDEPVILDTDGDGVPDEDDAFPNDPTESADTDGDGVGDNGDAFPNDSSETTDTDGDGVGDNGDVFPNDPDESADSDGDGVGDNGDAFPNSNMDATVVIGDCDSGVANQLLSDGATFNDLLGAAAMANKNHGHYVKAVSKLADTWKKAGLISGNEKGKITSCAARNK